MSESNTAEPGSARDLYRRIVDLLDDEGESDGLAALAAAVIAVIRSHPDADMHDGLFEEFDRSLKEGWREIRQRKAH